MSCQRCGSDRWVHVDAKSSDLNFVNGPCFEHEGYVPEDIGVGGGDYVDLTYCLDCGQIEGNWPLPPTAFERDEY